MSGKKEKSTASNVKVVTKNRKAYHDYKIVEKIEAGIVLVGAEVKSLREGKCQLSDAYAAVIEDEVFLINCHISQYKNAGKYNQHEPTRKRKLLLKHYEIKRVHRKVEQKGVTLIPLSVYFKSGIAKIEIGLCEGKKLYDKREAIKKRDMERDERRSRKDS